MLNHIVGGVTIMPGPRPEPPITLTITDPGRGWLDSNNANNTHPAVNRKTKQAWRDHAEAIARQHIQQHKGEWQPITSATITYTTHRTRNVRADADNLQPTCKAIRDGLVNAELLEDDHDGVITATTYLRGPKTNVPTITVTITPHT